MGIVGFGIGALCLLLPVLLLILIIVAVVKKNKDTKEGKEPESFSNVIRTIYVYIMLIVFLCTTIAGFLSFVDATIDYFLPLDINNYGQNLDSMLERNNDRNEIITNMYTYATVVIVSLPLFIYHGKLAKKQ